jgi:ribosomal protein S18 acetylase RimI-like enzyme
VSPSSRPASAPGVNLREETLPADVEAVRDLIAATGFFNAEEVSIAAELVEERLLRGPESGYEFLFAEREGSLIAYSCFGRIPCTQASWDLYWIAVHPQAQGTGLGRRLLQMTEDRVSALGGGAVYAETSGRSQYAPTRAFYTSCGYATAAVFEDFYAPGDAKYVFLKKLA